MKKSILNHTNTIITIVMLAFTSSSASLQAQDCGISVTTDPTTGIATATLSGSSWYFNEIDWGDGCMNNSTSNPVSHQYSNCGNFNITHRTCSTGCANITICHASVNIPNRAVFIEQTPVVANDDCGEALILRAVVRRLNSNCMEANGSVTIKGTVPTNIFDIESSSNYTITGNTVTSTLLLLLLYVQ